MSNSSITLLRFLDVNLNRFQRVWRQPWAAQPQPDAPIPWGYGVRGARQGYAVVTHDGTFRYHTKARSFTSQPIDSPRRRSLRLR